jgi:hypothetical protein
MNKEEQSDDSGNEAPVKNANTIAPVATKKKSVQNIGVELLKNAMKKKKTAVPAEPKTAPAASEPEVVDPLESVPNAGLEGQHDADMDVAGVVDTNIGNVYHESDDDEEDDNSVSPGLEEPAGPDRIKKLVLKKQREERVDREVTTSSAHAEPTLKPVVDPSFYGLERLVRGIGLNKGDKAKAFKFQFATVEHSIQAEIDLPESLRSGNETIEPITLKDEIWSYKSNAAETRYLLGLIAVEGKRVCLNTVVVKDTNNKRGVFMRFHMNDSSDTHTKQFNSKFENPNQACSLLALDSSVVVHLLQDETLSPYLPACLKTYTKNNCITKEGLFASLEEVIKPSKDAASSKGQPSKKDTTKPPRTTTSPKSLSTQPAIHTHLKAKKADTPSYTPPAQTSNGGESSTSTAIVPVDGAVPAARKSNNAAVNSDSEEDSAEGEGADALEPENSSEDIPALDNIVTERLSSEDQEILKLGRKLGKRTLQAAFDMDLSCEITKRVGGGVMRMSHSGNLVPYNHPLKQDRKFFEAY